ncbi:MAG: 8-amino-7-oxononanoate synthase [Muribaculaceae bacterium]|nr:8-amino-7-oxononanoate synthase [Muribaculaceae bacterium]
MEINGMEIEEYLNRLRESGNFRSIPLESRKKTIDFSTNDYMGIAADTDMQQRFFADEAAKSIPLTSSAARLLAPRQIEYLNLEVFLRLAYARYRGDDTDALLFNSGYHANIGLISAIARHDTFILADKLVHASIIDGIELSRASFRRFRHNDLDHLEQLIDRHKADAANLLVIVESVYSMDGDHADIDRLIDIKRRHPQVMIYVDEAHAFGVLGPHGLGLAAQSAAPAEIDIVVGTFGKAAGSAGAFAVTSRQMRQYLINTSRSFIFSTALPPMQAAWTRFTLATLMTADRRRAHLQWLGEKLQATLAKYAPAPTTASHIQPLIVGDPHKVVDLSDKLLHIFGIKALPIRKPTVAAGTERLRFSLNARMTGHEIDLLDEALAQTMPTLK